MATLFGVFIQGKDVECDHLQYCKKLMGVKVTTQTDYIYGEICRLPMQQHCYYDIQ